MSEFSAGLLFFGGSDDWIQGTSYLRPPLLFSLMQTLHNTEYCHKVVLELSVPVKIHLRSRNRVRKCGS